ncbi:MAG TPA: VOC family protein [Mycobacteriales bacterium]|nr:VOC family protein [Mycobacteriales bacterium]
MTSLQHVNVVIPPGRADDVASFYVEVFGLRRVDKPTALAGRGGAWLDVDGFQQLHLSERDGDVHPDSHFALVADDFADILSRLATRGAEWTEQEDVFGGRRGFTRDPAGNRVEVLERAGSLA